MRSSNNREDEDDEEEDDGDEEDEVDKEDEQEESRRKVTHGFDLVKGMMDHGMEDFIVAEKRALLDKPEMCNQVGLQKDGRRNFRGRSQLKWRFTAAMAILINREKLIVANVGDSRAIMCENGKAKQITVDHEPQKERELVESRGGFVSQRPGNVPRVDGQLAMTMAFGDEKVKDRITSEPDISIENIDKGTEFHSFGKRRPLEANVLELFTSAGNVESRGGRLHRR
ncbi:hypothetical protein NL676_012459 [Syzygium grande]|nr:hypothetical protein NL676_012459 [Syzygium grande]